MTKKSAVSSLLVGAAIGAASALLFAPKPGKELRSDLSNRYQGLCESTTRVAGNVSQTATELARSAADKAGAVISSAKDTLSIAKTAGTEVLEEGKEKLDDVKNQAAKEADAHKPETRF